MDLLSNARSEVRHALRALGRTPGLTGVSVVCLGLGIGLCSTLFATVSPWLYRSLPYADPDRLLSLRETLPRETAGTERTSDVSGPNYLDWKARGRSFAATAAYERFEYNVATENEPERVSAARITAGLFPLLGRAPALGRGLSEEEDGPGGRPVALLGHELWRRRFGGDPGVLGRTVKLDGVVHEIVGVMPPRFAFPEYAEVWTPLGLAPGGDDRGSHRLDTLARLAPGTTVAQAQADLDAVAAALALENPSTNRGRGVWVRPLLDDLSPPGVKAALRLVLAAGLFVLLIACANVANIMLARAVARRRDDALRLALGAGRLELLRQSLAESSIVALGGALLGLALARGGAAGLLGGTPVPPPFWVQMDLDVLTLAFTLALAVVSTLVVSLLPVLLAGRSDLIVALKEGARSVAGGPRGRLGKVLTVAELGLSLVLLVGAALMVRSFAVQFASDPGFDTHGVLTARVALSGDAYGAPEARARFLEEFLRRLQARPEIEDAGLSNSLPFPDPLYGGRYPRRFEVEGRPVEADRRPAALYSVATSGYLRTIRLPLVAGRLFNEDEEARGGSVALVSESLAAGLTTGAHRPGQPVDPAGALGRRIRTNGEAWLEVVGVLKDPAEPDDMLWIGTKASGQIYVPYRRDPWSTVTLVARTRSEPASEAGALREVLRGLDPALPLHGVFTLQEVRVRSMWLAATWGRMLGVVALFGLGLAALGVYGVVSHAVSQRTHELGVRMALGARPGDVRRLVLAQGAKLALIAIPAGLLGALALSGALAGLLHGVEPTDLPTLAGAALALTLVALLASYAPARRATRVDPVVALRSE